MWRSCWNIEMNQASFPGLFVQLLLKLKRDFCIFRFALEAKLYQIDVTRLDSPFSLHSKQKRANNKSGPRQASHVRRAEIHIYWRKCHRLNSHDIYCTIPVFRRRFWQLLFFITPLCTNWNFVTSKFLTFFFLFILLSFLKELVKWSLINRSQSAMWFQFVSRKK